MAKKRWSIGTPLARNAKKVMLLGSGELGKEVLIELQRYGCETIAVDRYENAPGMQVAHRSHVVNMLDGNELKKLIKYEKPDLIVPEIEAIATEILVELESEGFTVIPKARATVLTMNREGIRLLASETLGIETSRFKFVSSWEEYDRAVSEIGLPCVVKPVMSSSGKGQSTVTQKNEKEAAWDYAVSGARGDGGRVIVEEFVEFDYEITLLTVRTAQGTVFCEPIGHRQVGGDYQESWQPQEMSDNALVEAKRISKLITDDLGGLGLFGVELFVKGDSVIFSEVSPRPHDTGMVTMISQDLSEFGLHARAILGLPVPDVVQYGCAASSVIMAEGESTEIRYDGLDEGLSLPNTQVRLFGKPSVEGERRMGVALALGSTIDEARNKAKIVSSSVSCQFEDDANGF